MEKQRKDTVGLQPMEPNLLYQKPTNYARRKPMELLLTCDNVSLRFT